jgi:hypothetical protein
VKLKQIIVCLAILGVLILTILKEEYAQGQIYAPTDSVPLAIGTLDTTFKAFADADTVELAWYRLDAGVMTKVDSVEFTTGLMTGFYAKKVKASDASNNTGTYVARALVYKSGKSGTKTWVWTVKSTPDQSTTKDLYVKPKATATIGGTALSWADACSISTVLARCTGATEYNIHVAPGYYTDVSLNITTSRVNFYGAGMGRTILVGKKDVPTGLGSEYVLQYNVTGADSMAGEITGFSILGYKSAGGGGYDSSTHWGVYPLTGQGWYIHDNYISGCYYGFQTCTKSFYGRLERNMIYHCLLTGINLEGGYQCWIKNNVIDSMVLSGANGAAGIYITTNFSEGIINGNIIGMNCGRGIVNTATSYRNILADNFVSATGDSAYVSAGGTNFNIGNQRRSQINTQYTLQEDIASRLANSDSAIYQRTDWNNIKNPTTTQNLTNTRIRVADKDSTLLEGIKVKTDSVAGAIADANKGNFTDTTKVKVTITNNGWDDQWAIIPEIQIGLGWGDGWRQHFMPFSSANKDSLRIYDEATLKSTIYIHHTGSVVDSVTQEDW